MAPRIIPRKEHNISRKQINPYALRTLYRLRDEGFIAYLVGGCVRDLLLKRTPKDFDIATNATPGQIKRLFRNCRLIGRRFRLAHLHFKEEILEVSTFRADGPAEDSEEEGRPGTGEGKGAVAGHPRHLKDDNGVVLRDNVFGTPEEDALRRDFTINALAYNIADFTVIDYSTGLRDLRDRIIRPIGDPAVRFTEDPVRMLRAVRFAASHDFALEPAAWEVIRRLAPTISRSSPARLYEEVQKLFLLGSAGRVLGLLEESGLLAALLPGVDRRLADDEVYRRRLRANLDYLDQRRQSEMPPTPSFLLAALFGPSLEEAALAGHREGIPFQQALDSACGAALMELGNTVTVPARIGDHLRRILAMQQVLRRRPPRRPTALSGRQEFAEALEYLRMTTAVQGEGQAAREWWDAFLAGVPPEKITGTADADTPAPEADARKKRSRRRRPRRRKAAVPAAASADATG
ncbi:MAG TPA: polynucleotide adenylyltransferase PcnB [Syntrophales bacterium]|nr:polynucleotide adenylyltransferase PcnB [Syntrophales bacterium]HPX80348.1 polynucleotide adenylyltransferase PcnB [Syntrophales bacterium]HQB13153.1 polynucleotide adenylyltransferase PcnB [Syntrophales bacterium]